MNIGLELQIFSLSDDDINTPEGIDIPWEDCILVPYIFYNIDYITCDRTNPRYTTIGSAGEDFTCNKPYDVVRDMIEQISILRFN
jgi:hypothetical protein